MQPSLLQYFVAHWLLRLWLGGWTVVGVVFGAPIALGLLKATNESLLNPLWILMVFITPILAGAIGSLCGVIVGSVVLPPVCWWHGIVNGAPFHVGDQVRVLLGPYRNEVRVVYEVWDQRGEVRLDFGPQAKQEFVDVYSYLEICRDGKPVTAKGDRLRL